MTSKQLTIRGIEDELHNALKQQATENGMSINRFVIRLLQESTGVTYAYQLTEKRYHDLDHLAGTWGKAEYDQFNQDLQAQRTIDDDLWS